MKRAILALTLVLLLGPDATMTQTLRTEYGYALVIYKYDHIISVWGRAYAGGELIPAVKGEIYRSFPTGPKISYGDQRIPEGIYDGRIDSEGNISFRFQTLPDMFETYRISGPSLDRNIIPIKGEFIETIREVGEAMRNKGFTSIPVLIFPGALEPEVADMLEKAEGVREGQTLDDVKSSIIRWKPVEDYLINTGRIPILRFDGAKIHIVEPLPPSITRR